MVKTLEVAMKKILEQVVSPIVGRKKVYPVFGTGKPPFITYTITPVSGGTIKESQVEVKTIDGNIDKAIEIREAITKKLDMTGEIPSLNVGDIVLRSGLSGGGQLFNDSIQMWELSSIFIIKWRCKN